MDSTRSKSKVYLNCLAHREVFLYQSGWVAGKRSTCTSARSMPTSTGRLADKRCIAPADFFTQFGNVTNVRVSRNKKTGKAKHYAFLEFQYPEVAATAAEAMNDYMLFTQKLVVKMVSEKVLAASCTPMCAIQASNAGHTLEPSAS